MMEEIYAEMKADANQSRRIKVTGSQQFTQREKYVLAERLIFNNINMLS